MIPARNVCRRWATWLLPLLLLLPGVVVLQHRLAASAANDLSAEARLQDRKVRRTVARFHDMARGSGEPQRQQLPDGPVVAIEIDLDPETLALMRVKSNRRRYKKRATDAAVRFNGGAPQPATIGLRGVGTLKLLDEKLNFKVKLVQRQRFTATIDLKRFYLMNMGHDPHEVELVFSYRVLAELDLFPLHFQYIRVAVNGEPQGMYLLVERPKDGVRRAHPQTVAVYRRRKPNIYQTVWAAGVPDRRASIDRLRAASYPQPMGAAPADLGAVLDLDGYFTWLAVCSALMNPDVEDELHVFEVRPDNACPARLRVMAWDWDDILKKPNPDAVADPLIFSCRQPLDLRLHECRIWYDAYRRVLRRLLAGPLAGDRLVAVLSEVQRLRDTLDDGRASAVQAEARRERSLAVADFERKLRARHAHLLAASRDPSAEPPPQSESGRASAPAP